MYFILVCLHNCACCWVTNQDKDSHQCQRSSWGWGVGNGGKEGRGWRAGVACTPELSDSRHYYQPCAGHLSYKVLHQLDPTTYLLLLLLLTPTSPAPGNPGFSCCCSYTTARHQFTASTFPTAEAQGCVPTSFIYAHLSTFQCSLPWSLHHNLAPQIHSLRICSLSIL